MSDTELCILISLANMKQIKNIRKSTSGVIANKPENFFITTAEEEVCVNQRNRERERILRTLRERDRGAQYGSTD